MSLVKTIQCIVGAPQQRMSVLGYHTSTQCRNNQGIPEKTLLMSLCDLAGVLYRPSGMNIFSKMSQIWFEKKFCGDDQGSS